MRERWNTKKKCVLMRERSKIKKKLLMREKWNKEEVVFNKKDEI